MSEWGIKDDVASVGTVTITASQNLGDTSSASVVVVATNKITGLTSTVLSTGDEVTYSNGAGTSIGGLTHGATYWIGKVSSSVVKLYTSAAEALATTSPLTVAATIAVSGTAGQFTCGASTIKVGDRIVITGTKSGTATFSPVDGGVYNVSAVTGSGASVTGFTLTTESGAALVTAAGTLSGLTFSIDTGVVNITAVGAGSSHTLTAKYGYVVGSGTTFLASHVGRYLNASSQDFIVTAFTSTTEMRVQAALPSAAIVNVGAGTNFTLSEKPKFLTYAQSNNNSRTLNAPSAANVFGVDTGEISMLAGPAQIGWVERLAIKTGAIAAVDTIGAADAARKPGLYLVSGTSGGSGVGQLFRVAVDSSGTATIEVVQTGSGHADNDVITVTDSLLGGGGAANLTFAVNGITARTRYETLVALSHGSANPTTMSDATDDTYFVDAPTTTTTTTTAAPTTTTTAAPTTTTTAAP